jgi:hypothetical protein
MKGVLLIACAFGYGFLRAISGLSSPVLLLIPVLAGLIYFVLHQNDWPPALIPWMLVAMPVGRVAGQWLFTGGHHVMPDSYGEEWICLGLATLWFASMWWRRVHGEAPKEMTPPSR